MTVPPLTVLTPTPHPLIPAAARKRRFRADSFAAKLKPEQLARLLTWFETDSICEIQRKIAAPAPVGFGLRTHPNTLRRLRSTYDNTELNGWITEAMDTACDTLESDTGADPAPLRESLLLLLYTRALTAARQQADIPSIDRLISTIARLERIKSNGRGQHPESIPCDAEQSTLRRSSSIPNSQSVPCTEGRQESFPVAPDPYVRNHQITARLFTSGPSPSPVRENHAPADQSHAGGASLREDFPRENGGILRKESSFPSSTPIHPYSALLLLPVTEDFPDHAEGTKETSI